MTSASFNVSITNNDILEIDKDFELVINMSSLPSSVTVGIPAQVTVTIVDDDGKYMEILFVCIYAKQKHLGCKKVQGQNEAAL